MLDRAGVSSRVARSRRGSTSFGATSIATSPQHDPSSGPSSTDSTRCSTDSSEAEVQLAIAQRAFEPYRPSLDAAHDDVRSAQEAVWAANNQAMRAKGFKKRGLLREATKAASTLDDARAKQADVEAVAAPAKNRVAEAKGSVHQIQNTIRSTQRQMDRVGHEDRILWLGDLDAALDTWERWASGRSVADTDVIDAARCLREAATTSQADGWGYLATTVEEWGTKRGLKLAPTIEVAAPSVADGFGIEL